MVRLETEAGSRPIIQVSPSGVEQRDNNFNLLRLILASLVLLSHAPELTDGNRNREILSRIFHCLSFGELAVDGFFILSGFLIVQSWERQPQFGPFVAKRVLRIYPGFVVATLFATLIVGPLAADSVAYFRSFDVPELLKTLLLLRWPVTPSTFEGSHYANVNGVMWTISHEMRCYFLVPILGCLGFVRHRSCWLLFTCIALIYSLFGPTMPWPFMHGHFWNVLLPVVPDQLFRLLSLFCAGGCFYLYRNELSYRTGMVAGAVLLLALCLFHQASAHLGIAVFGGYLLFAFAFARIQSIRVFQRYSDVSYGVYLYGWPVQKLLIWFLPMLSPWVSVVMTFVISVGLGWLSWHFVELPFLRLKPRQVSSTPP